MPRTKAYFDVPGLAPTNDPRWRDAPAAVRDAFWKAAIAYVLKAKDQDLAAGLDKDGEPLKPIAQSTRDNRVSAMGPADPSAPPLMPAYATSRTRLWLTAKQVDNVVRVSWRNDWGQILIYHANKGPKKRRDVFGLSPEGFRKARGWLDGWWISWKRTGLIPTRTVPTTGEFRPLPVIGRTDFENFTFGVRTGREQEAEVARSRMLLSQGRTTGFFRRGPGQGLPAIGGPGGGRPTAPAGTATVGRPAVTRPRPQSYAVFGTPIVKERGLGSGWVTVLVDVAKVEAVYSQSRDFYVGVGGVDGIDDRYARFGEFLDESIQIGRALEQPRLSLDSRDRPQFANGRHRWAVLRDRGIRQIPVSVRRSEAARFRELFGA